MELILLIYCNFLLKKSCREDQIHYLKFNEFEYVALFKFRKEIPFWKIRKR